MTKLDLLKFVPFRMNRLSAAISTALSSEYRDRYGIEVPEWRVIATLGFREEPCTAQFVVQHTSTHKSTISRAVTSLLEKGLIERIENPVDRREYALQLSADGRVVYEGLIPRLLNREREILSALAPAELRQFEAILSKIEKSLDLVQADDPPSTPRDLERA
ncbi:MarR family transcriptional regulator [Bradyrhizobium sp. U87765 SZCCT0131]|uniref:MarR family winged helix-turn-helix transcriptional regulator n=1 Tax=unclassified Bradyrhizobium TaxID=2631580 RepID=UPI001BA713B4|nr:MULTISPECIES: MarR family transcriptional regulator [unclassified Bradyrhizobium]MBR1218311.1 MarR family transcriptional regulator [Bradyrhizobium sp. U87765 SZCCT0131]MBR1260743.1 MarR family transcriptional regulator [Bradyrhizobium sp. U87765 SZCCT0134]MBR1303809.1 MarR family transcriptional regulator [Bradyrhizobium sp. U87765 SZCCT0110]MBR1319415.1 MarR family transcriptional regulator [Bradyrhizobium sp. U87765 SZCCT0109]MBR1347740.1 MarR family transcriptional regulator [Bradyrhizo